MLVADEPTTVCDTTDHARVAGPLSERTGSREDGADGPALLLVAQDVTVPAPRGR